MREMEKLAVKPYTSEEIDKIVNENKERILEYCKELEIEYADCGRYSAYETMRVLFDLRDYELYMQVKGQGLFQEIVEGIEEGFIVEVYSFETGRLEEMAFEGLDCYAGDSEAEKLYFMYKNDEVSDEEYNERYVEVIQPWIDDYIENHVEEIVGIDINYFNAVEDYNDWYED